MDEVKQNMLKLEGKLKEYATFDKDAIRMKPLEYDIRPNYFRDIDRIIHSLSYSRYIDKTQVFSLKESDHITKRMIHVQLVSKIARTIGRALNLNEDLIEAIALGHDIGHVPFGHTGEAILNEITYNDSKRYFNHNVQSVRTLMLVENHGLGENLSIQTLDGILCHNGEFVEGEYYPNKKTKEEFLEEYNKCYIDKNTLKHLRPMTLEGCVVRISDIIGYVGRDIEDAVRLNVFDKKDLPKDITDVLGSDNRTIVNTIVLDIIENSLNKPYIKMSDKVYKALRDLKQFNSVNIYQKANTKEQMEEYKQMFNLLFETYKKEVEEKNTNSKIYKVFLNDMSEEYKTKETPSNIVTDYIAGMTDDYMVNEYKRIKAGN